MQALLLLNDIQYVECFRHMAARIHRDHPGKGDPEKLEQLWRMATGRTPEANELAEISEFLTEMLGYFGTNIEAANQLLSVGDSPPGDTIDPAEHAAWTMVCSLIMNLDEVITKG
jgi:hypothetical protein